MFKFKKFYTITFFMKSGNKIVVDKVEEGFTVTSNGNVITKISGWKQRKPKNNLMLNSLDLSQIEAVVYTN